MRFRSIVILLLAFTVMAGGVYLWRWPRPRVEVVKHEADTVLPPATEPSTLPPPSAIPPPALEEVQPALDRVFDRTVTVDRAAQPAFLAGDFNGDEVTDLAVAVRPGSADAPSKLNAELAPWGLQDATAPPVPAAGKPKPVKVTAGDRLLAVIHGVEGAGWRNPEARQGYLVKNAVGLRMQRRPLTGVPDAIRMRAYRTHIGDVIAESRGGKPGLIFWTGAAYAWADL